jgi:minichromosome maintenance protein 10
MDLSDEEIENLEKLLMAAEEPEPKQERSVYAPNFADILKNQQEKPELKTSVEKPGTSGLVASAIHNGDTDSSDDEDVRNFLEQKYNQYGRDVKLNLKQEEEEKSHRFFTFGKDKKLALSKDFSKNIGTALTSSITTSQPLPKPTILSPKPSLVVPSNPLNNPNIFCDPIFGLRIIHPLISSSVLVERMQGRTPVSVSRLRLHTEKGDRTADWVVAGVVTHKSPPKTSQKGDFFSIW